MCVAHKVLVPVKGKWSCRCWERCSQKVRRLQSHFLLLLSL